MIDHPMTPLALKTQARLRVGLGTYIGVEADCHEPEASERAIASAFEAVRAVERAMHPTRADSDLGQIAACPPGGSVTVHPWTWELLHLCARMHEASGRIFDPCLPIAPGRMRHVELPDACRVRVTAKVAIDLGGIAKGYAVDRALEALAAAGCTGGLVNAGGDLAVFGPRTHRIACRGSRGTRVIELHDAALASSDAGQPCAPSEHCGYYHGASGARAYAGQVSVIAPRAAVADGLTKCLFWLDPASAQTLLRQFGAHRADD